jgi:hypothetical protein
MGPVSRSKRDGRKRLYSLVGLGLVSLVGLVAMSTLLARGQQALDEKVYRYPHKTLHHLSKAERRYFKRNNTMRYAATLEDLGDASVITKRLASGSLGDYQYAVVHADAERWAIEATPAAITSTSLFYYVDQSGLVRANAGSKATPESDVYWSPFRRGWGE